MHKQTDLFGVLFLLWNAVYCTRAKNHSKTIWHDACILHSAKNYSFYTNKTHIEHCMHPRKKVTKNCLDETNWRIYGYCEFVYMRFFKVLAQINPQKVLNFDWKLFRFCRSSFPNARLWIIIKTIKFYWHCLLLFHHCVVLLFRWPIQIDCQ